MPRAHVTQRVDERPDRATRRHVSRRRNQPRAPGPTVTFLAWAEDAGRAHEVAQALGGEACVLYRLRIVWKPLVPLRYLLNTISTCRYLLIRRPRAVIVTNPPIFPGLIAFPYCAATKAPLLLDSHPSAFGDAPMAKQVLSLHTWLARHAATTMVTVPELAKIVTGWGGRADIVHEAPRPVAPLPPARFRADRASCTSVGSPGTSRPQRWWRRRGWCPRQTC